MYIILLMEVWRILVRPDPKNVGLLKMPYRSRSSRYRRNRQGYRRANAQKSIARAWRSKQRRKTSLNARTTLSNYRQIKRLKKGVETKVLDNVTANAGNRYGGQNLDNTQIDNQGLDTTGIPIVVRPLTGMGPGTGRSQRIGAWITVKSVTIKVFFVTNALVPDAFNRVGFLLVLDRHPEGDPPSLQGGAGLSADGQILEGVYDVAPLMWQDLNNCSGAEARFKVLAKREAVIQPVAAGSTARVFKQFTLTVKLPYKIRYEADGTSIQPDNQQLLIVPWSDSTIAPHPTVGMACRVRYKDG